jgi:hypothetical protein
MGYILDSLKEFKAVTAMLYLLLSFGFESLPWESFHKSPDFCVNMVFIVIPVSLQQSAW